MSELICEVRPNVAMGFLDAIGPCAALALASMQDGAQVRWPSDVVWSGEAFAVRAGARYDEGVVVDVRAELPEGWPVDAARDAVAAAIERWAQAMPDGAAAGPWGPFLSDYFDAMELMGQGVDAIAPSGDTIVSGRLAGIDGWGRVTIQSQPSGDVPVAETELAPGSATLVPAE
ncbi:hypothetical protein QJ043_05795 [Olsenella sp. YH-ols2217]|uniref:Uncharacterized protein n=1 Tax=Kribbibacterium absianum TaxID=3044210 RepID=A0ABT6ZKL5_9ACTN|nr:MULTISPECIES: hypothetical protein [unclassified Olsenella]MDJ1121585.1 hypothetical protein [Olsenella sp. YH-ols2216]MDJ1129593.1 hypothetical protein [Olsenella sp. YH-ols2217]